MVEINLKDLKLITLKTNSYTILKNLISLKNLIKFKQDFCWYSLDIVSVICFIRKINLKVIYKTFEIV